MTNNSINSKPGFVEANTTITVKTSGGDFNTIQGAIDSLSGKVLLGNVTIEIDDGTWTLTSGLTFSHPYGELITITGKNRYTKTLNSIQSTSGSAGNWTYILNLNDVTNIAIGDYILIYDTTGGSNPTYAGGCLPVTNVDGVNNRITVTSTNKSATVPSGNVTTANLQVIKTKIKGSFASSNTILSISHSSLTLNNVILEGYTNTNQGLEAGYSYVFLNYVGIYNCNIGFASKNTSYIRLLYCAGTNNTYNATCELHASIHYKYSAAVGNTYGAYIYWMSFLLFDTYINIGNTTATSPTLNTVGNNNSLVQG